MLAEPGQPAHRKTLYPFAAGIGIGSRTDAGPRFVLAEAHLADIEAKGSDGGNQQDSSSRGRRLTETTVRTARRPA